MGVFIPESADVVVGFVEEFFRTRGVACGDEGSALDLSIVAVDGCSHFR